MSFDRNSTLEQLEGTELGEPDFNSSLVVRAHKLHKQPVSTFTVEDLRLMIGQGFGLPFLIPLALEILESNPLAAGDYYPGDLLSSVLGTCREFWKQNTDLYKRVNGVVAELASVPRELREPIRNFRGE